MKSPLSMRHSKNVRHSVWCAVILLFTTSSAPLLARRCAEQIPRELWVLPFDSQDPAKMVLAESLQGLTGAHLPKLWIDKRGGMSAVILQQLQDEGTEIHMVNSVWDLPDDFWSSVDGAIVYNLGTHSLNTAVSLCGIKNAVAVDESILDRALDQGLTLIYDARGQSE